MNFLLNSDVNECESENECDVNASCENNEGSYGCECEEGYEGNGRVCGGKGNETVGPLIYTHGFVVLCIVMVISPRNLHVTLLRVVEGCSAGAGHTTVLFQCSSNLGYG